MRLREFAPAGGGGSGDYLRALASAWYNGTFDTGSLQKGIKSQEDVERLLNRGIVCPDGKTRKLHIDYNSDFDGVEIYSDDYYEYGDHDATIDSRTGQKWGPYDFMAFSDEDLSEGLNEFAADDGDSGGEDDALRNYARMWWAGDEATQMQIERALAKMGWEIGEDEGGYDNGGVFVVRAGDENGNSYQSWAAEDLTEGSAQDSKSWMASIRQQHPGVKFVQAKMPGAPIIALVNGKPVAQFDGKQGVAEGAPISGDGGAVDNIPQQRTDKIRERFGRSFARKYAKDLAEKVFAEHPKLTSYNLVQRYAFAIAIQELGSRQRLNWLMYDTDFASDILDAYVKLRGLPPIKQGMAEGNDPWGPQGRFVGDTGPAQISTTVPRHEFRAGDRVMYKPTGARATIENLYKNGTVARIHVASGMGGQYFDAKVADLRPIGQGRLEEKSTSQAQFRTMAAAAHDPKFARKVGIKQSVAREFNKADKGQSYKSLPKRAD